MNFVTRVKNQLSYGISLENWLCDEDCRANICCDGRNDLVIVDTYQKLFYDGVAKRYGRGYAAKLYHMVLRLSRETRAQIVKQWM
jgi:hypothetical protein